MALFENVDPKEFFLFVQNFNMTLAASGTLATGAKIQHFHPLVHGEALCQFDLLFSDMEGTNPLTMENIITGLALYFSPVSSLLKKNRAMRRRMRKLHGLKIR